MPTPMHVRYAEEFADLSLGLGLLHPCVKSRLHPGVCGYFDDQGDFKTIVDIPQIKTKVGLEPDDFNFTSLDSHPELPEPEILRWDPKVSSKVSVSKDKGEAGYGPVREKKS